MKVKVCGITSWTQMAQLQDAGADLAGMIFYEKSRRFAGKQMPGDAAAIRNAAITKVGVFVNASRSFIDEAIDTYRLNAVQLHGDETPAFCRSLMKDVTVIKVFRVDGKLSEEELSPFANAANYFLFDTATKHFGGSGQQFNWTVLEKLEIGKPFLLSGGIGLQDAEKIKTFEHADFIGVDVNSRFETSPGIKDIQQVTQFINVLKHG
jgi:phosphoribosylanthranilate isomerase